MNQSNKIITAFLAGAAAGALLGVLFAPAKGSETRAKIKEQGQKMTDEFQDVVEKGKEKMQDLRNKMNEKFSMADMREEEEVKKTFQKLIPAIVHGKNIGASRGTCAHSACLCQ